VRFSLESLVTDNPSDYNGGVSNEAHTSDAYLGDIMPAHYRLLPTKEGVTLQYLRPDGYYGTARSMPTLWEISDGLPNDPLEGAREIRRIIHEYIADEALAGDLARDLRTVAEQGYAACSDAVELLAEAIEVEREEDEEDEDDEVDLKALVTSPSAFADWMLAEGLEASEAEEALLYLGFERADDEGAHLCLWDADSDSWVETTLRGLWTHHSWPTGTVIYDASTHEPAWTLATWDDAAEGDEPFGYVHDHWDGDTLVQVRVLPFTRKTS